MTLEPPTNAMVPVGANGVPVPVPVPGEEGEFSDAISTTDLTHMFPIRYVDGHVSDPEGSPSPKRPRRPGNKRPRSVERSKDNQRDQGCGTVVH